MDRYTALKVTELIATAYGDAIRQGQDFVVVMGTVRGQNEVFVRDLPTHRACQDDTETMLAIVGPGFIRQTF